MPIHNLTDEERRTIKGALRRAFRQSDRMKAVLKAARVELPPAIKKDGTPGLRPQVRYRCAVCGELFPSKWVAVDHIRPVVPLDREEKSLTPDDLVNGIYSDLDNLQVLCSTPLKNLPKGEKSCHAEKTAEENFVRKGISEKGGTIEELRSKYSEYLKNKETERQQKELRKQQRLNKKQRKK